MKQRAFVAGNMPDLWAYVRNLANMLNNERAVLNAGVHRWSNRFPVLVLSSTFAQVASLPKFEIPFGVSMRHSLHCGSTFGWSRVVYVAWIMTLCFGLMVSAIATMIAAKDIAEIEDFCFFPTLDVQKMTRALPCYL
eukprot:2795898-Rhodomonas_salina.1